MGKMLFIYNPKSGKGLIRNHLSAIVEIFSASGYDVTVYPTRKEKDGCRVAQERAKDYDILVCSGGDGTLDEVVTGMMRSGVKRPIGYIPAGSTNDFGHSLGIPKQMDQAAEVIAGGAPFSCDIGKFNDEYFVYVAAFGFLTDVSYQTNQELKNVLGHTAYLLEGMKRVSTWKSYTLKIESEEFSDEGQFMYGMITNSTSVAGIKGLPGKNVELNDGLFEVMLVRTPQNIVDWQEVITAVLMRDESSKNVVRFKTNHLVVSSDEPVAWTRDGENGGEQTLVELTNLQQAMDIMTSSVAEETVEMAESE
ncbi:MAG: diacylglycerol kinase family lipid kinase [Lachnospiraceae bacterium]|nr:diacylglycerol kinase family lipid kinase [Lachnospiraceae bacterium]MDD7077075.1 diacylglycerol kinase family lipid kinase [Lachnospiraceae bacterium]MDY3729955.1 diacylglycerol kinase family lipid kinase [Candidatus Choladocola sp.]